ncbi:MAG: hypothetical protein JNL08_21185 [Planctomycetes bacterium]|nr:hypothetical protein [Planctomycetota bacterium]
MIANVDVAAAPAERLVAFAGRLRRRHVRRAAEGAAVRAVLALAVPAIAAAWLLPTERPAVAVGGTAIVAVAAAAAALRARSVRDAALLRADAGRLDGLGDELATWLEQHRRRGDPAMVDWLGRAVDAQLPQVPPRALARVGRRPLGRWRRLLPIALLCLLVWLVAEWLAPPWAGVAGGGGGAAASGAGGAGSGDGGSGDGAGAGGASEPAPEPRPEPPAPPPPPRPADGAPPPPPPTETPPPAEPPAEPAPLLDLPAQQRFVVPEFFGDGPTRRVRMHTAELARRGAAPPAAASGDGTGEAPAPPPPTAAEFARAAEAAQRARHVPDEERPMVRRFFDLLREAAK